MQFNDIIFYGGEYLVYEEDWEKENKIDELENPEPHQLYSDFYKQDLQFCDALREDLLSGGVDITKKGMGNDWLDILDTNSTDDIFLW